MNKTRRPIVRFDRLFKTMAVGGRLRREGRGRLRRRRPGQDVKLAVKREIVRKFIVPPIELGVELDYPPTGHVQICLIGHDALSLTARLGLSSGIA